MGWMPTCESGSIAVGGRVAGEDGFPALVSLLFDVFLIDFIGDFLPFVCVLPGIAARNVSVSVAMRSRSHSIGTSLVDLWQHLRNEKSIGK